MVRKRDVQELVDSSTKADLYNEARELDIPGRSSMTEAELAEAVLNARGELGEAGTGREAPAPAGKAGGPSRAISTKETDFLGRVLVTPGVEAKDHLSRLTTATVDYLGRALIDA